jgi:hypothetical protein
MRLRRTGVAALVFGQTLRFATLVGGCAIAAAGCPRGGGGGPRVTAQSWELGGDLLGEEAIVGVVPVRGAPGRGEAYGEGVVISTGRMVRWFARGGEMAWFTEVAATWGLVGAVAVDGDVVAVAISGAGDVVPGLGGLRGEPGAAIRGLGGGDGAARWVVGVGASRWSAVHAIAPAGDGFLLAGSFAGTLRVGERTVTSAGNADGFVASLDRAGAVRWVRRMGGDGPDAVTGVAALGAGRIAIAGTFTGPAELGDTTLDAVATNTPASDGFVAVVESDARVAWARTWGSTLEDTCAGLAVLSGGAIAIAGTARGEVDVAGRRLEARGTADGLVAVFASDASVKGAWLVGGDDFDGVTSIAGAGDRIAVAGWFTGTLADGAKADGIDDVFVAEGTADGLAIIHPFHHAGPSSATAFAATAAGWYLAVHAAEPAPAGGVVPPAAPALWFRGW